MRQVGRVGIHPVGCALWTNTQMATYPTQVHSIYVELNGLLSDFILIPVRGWLRRVAPLAQLAKILLCPRLIPPILDLLILFLTVSTFHRAILAHRF